MNWIGKLSNYAQVNVPKEQTDEVKQQQSPAPLSTLGIAGTNDQFETVNPAISQFAVPYRRNKTRPISQSCH